MSSLLQHYLLNATKYFASNTQLLFLPGIHHLHTDLIIQNVQNISLVGNKTQDVVIQFNYKFPEVVMANISNLTISSLIIQDDFSLIWNFNNRWSTPLVIKDCSFVTVHQLTIFSPKLINEISIVGVNILGDSNFIHVTCDGLHLEYQEKKRFIGKHSTLLIDNLTTHGNQYCLLQINIPTK